MRFFFEFRAYFVETIDTTLGSFPNDKFLHDNIYARDS